MQVKAFVLTLAITAAALPARTPTFQQGPLSCIKTNFKHGYKTSCTVASDEGVERYLASVTCLDQEGTHGPYNVTCIADRPGVFGLPDLDNGRQSITIPDWFKEHRDPFAAPA